MPIENFTNISVAGLDQNNPAGSDPGSDLDNHIRGTKGAIKYTFPNFTTSGQVDATQAQLNNPLLKTALAANKVPYYTGTSTAGTFDISAFGLSLVAQAAAANVLALIGADAKYAVNNATNSANITFTGTVQAAAFTVSSTSPSIVFSDTDWGSRQLHCNTGLFGFLRSDGNWSWRNDNAGSTWQDGTAYAGNFYISSDPRLKKDIRPISKEAAEAFVRNVNGYVYRMIDTDKLTSGVMSTEVKAMVPALVSESEGFDRVNYDAMQAYQLVHANAETQRNDNQDLMIRALRDEIAELRRIVETKIVPVTGAP